jgi:hypothetical protein
MPENLVHCQNCRTLLNTELETDSVEIPPFVPLEEIAAMVEVAPIGFFVACPHCDQELRINNKYRGQKVGCKFCEGPFRFDLDEPSIEAHAFYADCPHCGERLRVAQKYLGKKVACKHCEGHIHFVDA